MITRIVKLHISDTFAANFETLFKHKQHEIKQFEGCVNLALLADTQHPNLFFTISEWQNEKYLEKYRKSAFFCELWAEIKPHFIEKPEAWSLNQFT